MQCMFFVVLNLVSSLLFFAANSYAQAFEEDVWVLDNDKVEQMLSDIQASASDLKEQLYENVAALDEVYRDLEQFEFKQGSLTPFYKRRGKLPWPVKGVILHRYGAYRIHEERWKGIYIKTAPETAVRTLHGGKVVFADWLKGLGLLMIVEHQGGYMTLYGNNTVLTRKKGDRIEAGEVIATTGFGPQGHGLYFEIRKNGMPVDPGRWLYQR